MTKSRKIAAALAALMLVGQFAVMTTAEAKRSKCTLVPVAGKTATFIAVCTTHRP